jgi:YebC/PmpR family DNA-binding regulatory protein
MGRAFEYRKERKMKRWSSMSRIFTKIGREISIAVKSAGVDPNSNSRLRIAIQNSKAANMPKANVEAAIKKASSKDVENFEEIVYEGYGPHGVAIIVETATDNPTRTVANLRMYFNKCNGSLGVSGSVSFMFEHKAEFKFANAGLDFEVLEMELIDFGLDDLQLDEENNEVFVYTAFEDFGTMQKALEDKGIEVISANLIRIPNVTKELTEEQQADIYKLLEKLDDDDDVQQVFHSMA